MMDNTLYKNYVNHHTIFEDGPDGHRLWRSRSGHLFIFDRSGDDPLDCDDAPIQIPSSGGKIICSSSGMELHPFDYRYPVRITASVAAYLVNERDYSLTLSGGGE